MNTAGQEVKYSVSYTGHTARVTYFGDISNEDIKAAHFELNGDERFYDCENLILDVSRCSLVPVSVPDLKLVIATDLGASVTINNMKVAMIANTPANVKKVTEYIERSKRSPWEIRIYESVPAAERWFNGEVS